MVAEQVPDHDYVTAMPDTARLHDVSVPPFGTMVLGGMVGGCSCVDRLAIVCTRCLQLQSARHKRDYVGSKSLFVFSIENRFRR